MRSHEHTDPDGDALTISTHNGQTWITCTSGRDEVTIGPLLMATLGTAFTESRLQDGTDPED